MVLVVAMVVVVWVVCVCVGEKVWAGAHTWRLSFLLCPLTKPMVLP